MPRHQKQRQQQHPSPPTLRVVEMTASTTTTNNNNSPAAAPFEQQQEQQQPPVKSANEAKTKEEEEEEESSSISLLQNLSRACQYHASHHYNNNNNNNPDDPVLLLEDVPIKCRNDLIKLGTILPKVEQATHHKPTAAGIGHLCSFYQDVLVGGYCPHAPHLFQWGKGGTEGTVHHNIHAIVVRSLSSCCVILLTQILFSRTKNT
jgi:hypothetical protein